MEYTHHDIDSSPESYRSAPKPPMCKILHGNENITLFPQKNRKLENDPPSPSDESNISDCNCHTIEGTRQFNFYLKRRAPNSTVEDKDWIAIKRGDVL